MKISTASIGFVSGVLVGLVFNLYLNHSILPAYAAPESSETTAMSNNSGERIVYVPRLIRIPDPKLTTLYDITSTENFYCLAQNIYFESRNQSNIGQEAVAWVTMNRVFSKDFPNNICEVVWQDGQFSWTHDGKSDRPRDVVAWEKANAIAKHVLENYNTSSDPTEKSLYFHAEYSRPNWRSEFNRVVQIDDHIFYNIIENNG